MSKVPEQLQDSVNEVSKALGIKKDEIAFTVNDMVNEAIRQYFGPNPSEMIAQRIIEVRENKHKEAMNELVKRKFLAVA